MIDHTFFCFLATFKKEIPKLKVCGSTQFFTDILQIDTQLPFYNHLEKFVGQENSRVFTFVLGDYSNKSSVSGTQGVFFKTIPSFPMKYS